MRKIICLILFLICIKAYSVDYKINEKFVIDNKEYFIYSDTERPYSLFVMEDGKYVFIYEDNEIENIIKHLKQITGVALQHATSQHMQHVQQKEE